RRLRQGEPVRAEGFLSRHPLLADDPEQALDVIYVEYVTRRDLGQAPLPEELFSRFPQWRMHLERQFQLDALLDEPGARLPPDRAARMSNDRFRIGELLARGGVGQVMRAIDTDLNREVAVKELQPSLAESDEARERFLREAEITGKLEHPGVVPVY